MHSVDREGRTVLHAAAYAGRRELLEMLLPQMPNVNVQDHKGRTLLHYAALFDDPDHLQALSFLLEHGAAVCLRYLLLLLLNFIFSLYIYICAHTNKNAEGRPGCSRAAARALGGVRTQQEGTEAAERRRR
jgi:ankyrin repeat protein